MASVVNISHLDYTFLGDMIFDVLLSRDLCRECAPGFLGSFVGLSFIPFVCIEPGVWLSFLSWDAISGVL